MALQLDQRGIRTTCSSCGTTNRLVYGLLDRKARCGHCQTTLRLPDVPIDVPDAVVFDALVRGSAVPVVVDFWAPWCGPCRVMAPELEKVARATAGELVLVKVNTEAIPQLGARYRIQSIPTLAVFRDGSEVTRTAGARPAAVIQDFVRQALLQRAS